LRGRSLVCRDESVLLRPELNQPAHGINTRAGGREFAVSYVRDLWIF
jgi:hypothetical protein